MERNPRFPEASTTVTRDIFSNSSPSRDGEDRPTLAALLQVWLALLLAMAVFWAYFAVGFWAINGHWLKAAWRVVAG